MLRRLEEAGLVRSRWEEADEARRENRPSRKYYDLRPAATPVLEAARERFPATSEGAILPPTT